MVLFFVFFFNSFLRRGFGMSSNLWYKYRLLVLGSATYTLKPLNSEDNCFRVIPCTCATLKTRLGLWEQLTKFWKDAICFLWISLFTCLPAQASQGGARDCAGTGPVLPGPSFQSCSTPAVLQCSAASFSDRLFLFCLSVSKMWSFRTKLLESSRITSYSK